MPMLGYHCLGSIYARALIACPHKACYGLGYVPRGWITKALACPWDPSKAMAATWGAHCYQGQITSLNNS